MVNSGTFESSQGQESDKSVIASCLQLTTTADGGSPVPSDQSSDDKLRCSVPLEKLEGVLTTYQPEDLAKTRSAPRKLLCLYCDRSFVSANLRQKHVERAHSSKKIRRISSRGKNQLTATPCLYCDKLKATENTLTDLFQHLVRDHPDRYFGCSLCEDRFLTQALLTDHNVSMHRATVPSESVKSPAKTTLKETPPEVLFQEKEVVIKITRSRVKPRLEEVTDEAKNKPKLKKLSVKSSRMALKKRESKRLQALAKITDNAKKRRVKPERKQLAGGKAEQQNSTKPEKAKPSTSAANPYPELDNFYRVKKITDHSIDNLKISSLTFDDVFDKAFFNRIKCNIEENLLHHIDGKLFKNEESETRISNFEKISNAAPEIQNANSDNYGCELSLNAVTPVASLSLNSQFGEDFESQIEYGSKPSKKKTQTKADPVFHYKYFTRRKFQASILQQKENRDLSKLDMWTQLVIKNRQQKIIDDKKSPKEIQEYVLCDEYKSKMKREELNRILDRRGPFEDLKEEASKKAALDKLNSASQDSISHESFTDVREALEEILQRVFIATGDADTEILEEQVSTKKEDQRELPSYLSLRRTSALPTEGDIDRSDRIALICSSQETENYELPTNQARRQNELVELSGEWARCRMYVCAACGAKLPNMKYLLDHKSLYHQNVWVQHYEFVGNQNELYRHLSIPALGKVGYIEDNFQSKVWKRSEARSCTKCGKQCNSLGELHRHILECGGDWSWMLARKKCKYRPCKSRRKRLRGLVHRIRHKEKDEPTEKKKYKKTFEGPRQRPSDAETIQRMLANLPAKRSTRKLISLYDGVRRARKNNQLQQQNLNQKKVKCGKVIYKSSSIKENTEKTINTAPSGLKTQKPSQCSNRRSLRNITRVLSSRILDTNANLNVKRKLKALNGKRSTRQSKVTAQTIAEVDVDVASKDSAQIAETKTDKLYKQDTITQKRTSPRSTPKNIKIMNVKKRLAGNLNMKSFFPVKKQKSRKALRETQASKETDNSVDIKAKVKRRSNESDALIRANEETLENEAEPKKAKSSALKKIVRSLSMKKNPINVKSPAQNSPETVPAAGETHNQLNRVEGDNSNNKRKLKRSFRNVINRVKRLKIDSAPESMQIKTKEINTKSTFLGETNIEHPNQSVKIVIPSNSEAKENLADISETAHIATNFNKTSGGSPIPENIFKLGSNDEKSLQAKGDLDFDSQQVTDKVIESSIIEIKTETDISQKLPTINEKIEPLTIETSEKPKVTPLVSPNVKGKIKKPARGLNDCIAMLTSKLQQKTIEPLAKASIFNLTSPNNGPRILSDPAPQKSDCILKIPNFKTQKETSVLEETALDLSVKPKDHSLSIVEAPVKPNINIKNSDLDFAVANKPYFKPFPFSIRKMPDLSNSVERIINSVIENNFQKESSHAIWKAWNTVDQTIQNVIDGYHKNILESTPIVSKNSVDDIIDFVATFGKEDNNNKLSLILKQPGDRSKLKTTKKPSPNKKTKKLEILKDMLSGPTLDIIPIIPEYTNQPIDEDIKKKNELSSRLIIPVKYVLETIKDAVPLDTTLKLNNSELRVEDGAPNNLDATIEYVVKDSSSIEESKQSSVDPIAKTAIKKLSQFRRSKDKSKNVTANREKLFLETHLGNVSNSGVISKTDVFTSPPITEKVIEDNVEESKTKKLALTSKNESDVLENKVVVQLHPSDSEDDIPLAALVKPSEPNRNRATVVTESVKESPSKFEQVTSDHLSGDSTETPEATDIISGEKSKEDIQKINPISSNEENDITNLESQKSFPRLESEVGEVSREGTGSVCDIIIPVGTEDSDLEKKDANENLEEILNQVIDDVVEATDFKVPAPKTKRPTKTRSLSKKKHAPRKNVVIENDQNSFSPQNTIDETTSTDELEVEILSITDKLAFKDLATITLEDTLQKPHKDNLVEPTVNLTPEDEFVTEIISDVSNQVITDSSFVNDLPFSNEDVLPDVLLAPKRIINQRKRTKRTKFSRKKPKKRNLVPIVDILKDITKPTGLQDSVVSNEPSLIKTINEFEISETSKESLSTTLPNDSILLSEKEKSIEITNCSAMTEATLNNSTITIIDSLTSVSTVYADVLPEVTAPRDTSLTKTNLKQKRNHQRSRFSSIGKDVSDKIDKIILGNDSLKKIRDKSSKSNEHNFKIPMSDDSMLSDPIKPENFKKKSTRSKSNKTRSRSLKFDIGMSSSDESPSPVKLRSRSLKTFYREPSSDDSLVNEMSRDDMESDSDTFLSKIHVKKCLRAAKNDLGRPPFIEENAPSTVDTTANFISETLSTLRKELGLPSEDLKEPTNSNEKYIEELTPKRSARLSVSNLSLQDNVPNIIEAPVDPQGSEAEDLELQKTTVTEMIFKTPTKKSKSRKSYLVVSTDESDLNENSELSNTEDTPNKNKLKSLMSIFNQLTSESELEESSQSDASFKTKTRRSSRSLVNEFKEPIHYESQSNEELSNCDIVEKVNSAVELSEGLNSNQKMIMKKVSKKRCKPPNLNKRQPNVTSNEFIESTGNSESSDSDFVDFQSRRSLRISKSLKNGTVKKIGVLEYTKETVDDEEKIIEKLFDSNEMDFEVKRPKRSSRSLNNNVNIDVKKMELVTDVSLDSPVPKILKAPRNNGQKKSFAAIPDISSELVDEVDEIKSGLGKPLEIGMQSYSNDSMPRQNSRSLRKKLAINYLEIEESSIILPNTTDDSIKANDEVVMKTKSDNDTIGYSLLSDIEAKSCPEQINTIPDSIFEQFKSDLGGEICLPAAAKSVVSSQGFDLINVNTKTDEPALPKPLKNLKAKKSTKKKVDVELNQLLPSYAPETSDDIGYASSVVHDIKNDTPVVAILISPKINKDTETEPPIKLIINKQKARRKSKSIKKIDSKGQNDLFEDFALVIKKKRTTPFMSFSPPDTFSKEDTDTYSLFLPKPLEIQQIPDKTVEDHVFNNVDENQAELDVSVEEMDMELDEIPINASIIENTLNLSLPSEKSHGADDVILFDSSPVEINHLTESSTNKNKTRNGRKNKNSRNNKLLRLSSDIYNTESELEIPVVSKDISLHVPEDATSYFTVRNDHKPEKQTDSAIEVEKSKPVKRTSKKGKGKPNEECGIPLLSYMEDATEQNHPAEENLDIEEPATVMRINKVIEKSTEECNEFEIPTLHHMENSMKKNLLVEDEMNKIDAQKLKIVKRTPKKSERKLIEEHAKLDIPILPYIRNSIEEGASLGALLKNSLEASNIVKRLSKKSKEKSLEKYAEFDNPGFSHMENTNEHEILVEKDLDSIVNNPIEIENLKTVRKTSKKGKGKSIEEFAEFDNPLLPLLLNTIGKGLLDDDSLDATMKNQIRVENSKTVKKISKKTKGKSVDEYSESDIPALPPMGDTIEQDILVGGGLDALVKNPIKVAKPKTVKRTSKKAKGKYMKDCTEFDIPLYNIETDAIVRNTIDVKLKTVKRKSKKVKGKSVKEYAELCIQALPQMENAVEQKFLIRKELGTLDLLEVENLTEVKGTLNKSKESIEEYGKVDCQVNIGENNLVVEKDLDAIVQKTISDGTPRIVKKTLSKSKEKSVEEYAEFDNPELPHMENTEKQDHIVEKELDDLDSVAVEKLKVVKRFSKNAIEESIEDHGEFKIPPYTMENDCVIEKELDAIVKNSISAGKPRTVKRTSNKSKGRSVDEYAESDIPVLLHLKNRVKQGLLVEEKLGALGSTEVENPKVVKKILENVKGVSEVHDEFEFQSHSSEDNLVIQKELDVIVKNTIEVGKPRTVKKKSKKAKGKYVKKHAEFNTPALPHMENIIEQNLLVEKDVFDSTGAEKLKVVNETLKKDKGESIEENHSEFDNQTLPPTLPPTDTTMKKDLLAEKELAKIVKKSIEVEHQKTAKITPKKVKKLIQESAKFDILALPYLENTTEKDLVSENKLITIDKNAVEVKKRKTVKNSFKKSKVKSVVPTLSYIENTIERDLSIDKNFDAMVENSVNIGTAETVNNFTKKSKRELEEYAECDIPKLPQIISTIENEMFAEEELCAINEKSKQVKKIFKKCKGKPKSMNCSNYPLATDDMTKVTSSESKTHFEINSEENCSKILHYDSALAAQISTEDTNCTKYNNSPPFDITDGRELPLKDKDIDLIYAFSEMEDLEINTPIELPRRLPRNPNKTIADDSDHKDEQQRAKKKPKQKKISTLENDEEAKEISVGEIKENGIDLEENGRRKPMRSAKVKALEYIHDDALAELTESERNRVIRSTKITQNESEAGIETTNKRNKKQNMAPEVIENATFSYDTLAEDEAPLLAELVAELHGLEELENSIERELMKTTDTKDQADKEPVFEESLSNNNSETVFEDNQELRRSRRGSRKVASYNENDLIDPIIDALESKRIAKKKDNKSVSVEKNQKKSKEPEKKLNSDQLFDLLKASTTESIFVPKQQNSFLNDLGDVSRDINDENFDTVFKDFQEKNKEMDKIYNFNVATEQLALHKSSILSKPSDESSLSSSSYKLLTPDIQDSSTSEETKSRSVAVIESIYCEICNKSFIRVENLVKHRRTLTHIQKLSEIEAKEAELKLHQEQTAPEIPVSFTNTSSLKLADIISEVLNKPVLGEETSKFPDMVLQNTSEPEVKRYKSLGERKSFESDSTLLQLQSSPFESKTTVLEKQISLLEEIIEKKGNNSYIDDISLSSDDSILSSKEVVISKNDSTKTIDNDSFLKPTQYEEISEDSANLRNYEDQKLRKTLNRDEELFLECCSLLKSGSEVSSSYSNKRMPHKDMGSGNVRQVKEIDWLETKNLVRKPDLDLDDYSDDNSRIPTPLGDSFDDDASNSNTISSNWGVNVEDTCLKEDGSTRLTFHGISAEKLESSDTKFQELLKKDRTPSNDVSTKSTAAKPKNDESDSKKIITKGARKVFEGLKVSIPTEELNLEEVLNCSPKPKKLEVPTGSDTFSSPIVSKPTKNARKSKPVKKSQVGSNILFKVNKKKLLSPTALPQPSSEKSDDDRKNYDVYDFEETQDNTDVFTKPDFKAFRHLKTGDNEGDSEPESMDPFNLEPESMTSSVSSISSAKKSKDQENITKKKCMIMGRIFKNAAKSKIEDIDEEIRTIPTIDNGELVEKYVASCNNSDSKSKLPENEMNQLFNELLDTTSEQDNAPKPAVRKPEQKKKLKPKGKKRTRANSESTDDEFSLNTTKRRSGKKNGKEEDNCINLEQELKECIGVASRKSQRSCTSGKQNVLVEYWSSDDSQFEAMLEKQIIEMKPAKKVPVDEQVNETITVSVEAVVAVEKTKAEHKKPPHKKRPAEKKSRTLDVGAINEAAASNRRKRAAANPLYHWSSSSEDEADDLIEVKAVRDEVEDDEERPVQHGWIVGESPKKLVMMLAQAKGKKTDIDCVKEQGKKRTNAVS